MEPGTQLAALQPTKISLPASASPILESLEQDLQDGRWSIRGMPRVTGKLQDAARRTIALVEPRMAPADPQWAAGALATLLTHYYTADLPRAVYDAVRRDWLACLADYPAWVIERARIEWLKTGKRKPIPSDIVALCNKAVGKDRATLLLCKRILAAPVENDPAPIAAEEREANKAAIAEIVRGIANPIRNDHEILEAEKGNCLPEPQTLVDSAPAALDRESFD